MYNSRDSPSSREIKILEDSDDEYDPKTEDINQFCHVIGLDPITEPELLWIAKEGIASKVEPPWKAVVEEQAGLYYFNFETGESLWEHPTTEDFRAKVKREREKLRKSKSKNVVVPESMQYRANDLKKKIREYEALVTNSPLENRGQPLYYASEYQSKAPTPSAVRPDHASESDFRERKESDSSKSESTSSISHTSLSNSRSNSERKLQSNVESESKKSPRLGPIRTPRSNDNSMTSSLDFLKTSNDETSSKLNFHVQSGTHISKSESDSLSDNVHLDINQLEPIKQSDSKSSPKYDLSMSEKDSEDSSFQIAASKFLKKNPLEEDSLSKSSKSSSRSKSRKSSNNSSVTSLKSSSKRGSRNSKVVPKINPKNATRLNESVSAQIQQKKIQVGVEIEEEMKRIQLDLLDQRQKRYEEIMESHENEMIRMEREAQRINAEEEIKMDQKLTELRAQHDSNMNEAIERERNQFNLTKESALNGLRASLDQQKNSLCKLEQEQIQIELNKYKIEISERNKSKIAELKLKIENEESTKIHNLSEELHAKKHENERLADQQKQMYNTLRAERAKIETTHREELVQIQDQHNDRKQTIIARNGKEIREIEKKHLEKMNELHLKFEEEMKDKQKNLMAKRHEFDQKIETWEQGHVERKMAWAKNSMDRNSELEKVTRAGNHKGDTESPDQTLLDKPLTRIDLDRSDEKVVNNNSSSEKKFPASERLREYLKGLEKKLETVESLNKLQPSSPRQSNSNCTRLNSRTNSDEYVSERWRAYYGTDFKYISAKQELQQRTQNDYRYRHAKSVNLKSSERLRNIIQTSSY